MELLAPRHLLVILLIALLVFGTKKIRTIGADLGAAVRGFKKAMNEGEVATAVDTPASSPREGSASLEMHEDVAAARRVDSVPK